MWRRIAFLLIAAPLVCMAVVLLMLSFDSLPRSDLFYALAVVSVVTLVALPAGITIWGFSILMADRRRGWRKSP